MTPPSPYPRGDACANCGQSMGLENVCWCRRTSPVLKTALAIAASCLAVGAGSGWIGAARGPMALFLLPFGVVIYVGAGFSGLLILFDEIRSELKSG